MGTLELPTNCVQRQVSMLILRPSAHSDRLKDDRALTIINTNYQRNGKGLTGCP